MTQERIQEIETRLSGLYREAYEAYYRSCANLSLVELNKKVLNGDEAFRQVNELNTEIAKVKKELEELKNPKPKGLWKPGPGEAYFYLNERGDVRGDINICTKTEDALIAIGNCYPTEAAARRQAQKLEVLQKIREIAASDGWVADWEDGSQTKFYPMYDYRNKEWIKHFKLQCRALGVIYMSEASAERCIAELGDELNVLLEG